VLKGEGDMDTDYKWYEAYRAAVLETDWTTMEERIQGAESALQLRLSELSMDHGGTPEEQRGIADALHALNVLRKDAATWLERKKA
jgi:hypothetical protein